MSYYLTEVFLTSVFGQNIRVPRFPNLQKTISYKSVGGSLKLHNKFC